MSIPLDPKYPEAAWEVFQSPRMNQLAKEGDMKLVIHKNDKAEIIQKELFDLGKDIAESSNLADELPEVRDRLLESLNSYLESVE